MRCGDAGGVGCDVVSAFAVRKGRLSHSKALKGQRVGRGFRVSTGGEALVDYDIQAEGGREYQVRENGGRYVVREICRNGVATAVGQATSFADAKAMIEAHCGRKIKRFK